MWSTPGKNQASVSGCKGGHLHISCYQNKADNYRSQQSFATRSGRTSSGLLEYICSSVTIKHGLHPPGEACDHLPSCQHVTPGHRQAWGATSEQSHQYLQQLRRKPGQQVIMVGPSFSLYSRSVVVTETKSDKLAALKPNFSL